MGALLSTLLAGYQVVSGVQDEKLSSSTSCRGPDASSQIFYFCDREKQTPWRITFLIFKVGLSLAPTSLGWL